jgi:CheY-like chemotaxis protein/HPt (histidine-containing phosphotransfer) domain-containing protein
MAAELHLDVIRPHTSPEQLGEQRGAADGPRILVVDDAPVNRVVIQRLLRLLGYRCQLAANGREAVDAVQRDVYAAVLMDCLMPEMDGYEAATAIRQREREQEQAGERRHLPIIAVTAVAIEGARERCIAAGMDDYLSKPIVAESLLAVLDRWLAGPGGEVAWAPEPIAASPAADNCPVDPHALDVLRELDPDGDAGLVAEVVRDFSTDVVPRFQALRLATADGDTRAILQELHFIAGCASIVGATQLERLARSLESAGALDAVGGAPSAAAFVDRLEAELLRAQRALESLVAT